MKSLKSLVTFIAGGITFMYLFAKGCERDSKFPREGNVILENDEIKVIRMGTKRGGTMDLATIVYKKLNKEENEES